MLFWILFILFTISIDISIYFIYLVYRKYVNRNKHDLLIKQSYKWVKLKNLTLKIEHIIILTTLLIKKFESNLLKINRKLHRDFDIYYIGYNTIQKLFNNPLFLIISSAAEYFEEEYDEKYLFLDSTKKYE